MCCQDEKLDGIVVEEECPGSICKGTGVIGKTKSLYGAKVDIHCSLCNGIGVITRPAEWEDIPEGLIVDGINCLIDNAYQPTNKSGGKLKVKK